MTGAYLDSRPPYAKWLAELRAASGSEEHLRNACRRMLGLHASTRERLPDIETIYATLFEACGTVTSVLDIACGLNPLTASWMPLQPGSRYVAIDLFEDLASFLQKALDSLGLRAECRAADVLGEPPEDACDLALLLKCLPLFERNDRNAMKNMLAHLKCRHMAASYPVVSLGGRAKGMRQHYARQFESLAAELRWDYVTLSFPTELVFLASLDKEAARNR